MGNLKYSVAIASIVTMLFISPYAEAATVIGPAKFTNNSTYTSGIDTRFKLFTSIDRVTLAQLPVACGSNPATAIFDGQNALFCNVTGGRRTVTYDVNSQNPGTLSPFGVHLYYGSAEVTPLYWSWSTGGASNSIYGTGTSAIFTPSIKPIFSNLSSKNNYVSILATYSTVGGKLYARCGTPVSVTRTFNGYSGARGFRGYSGHSPVLTWSGDQIAIDGSVTGPHLTGPAGSVTETQVRSLLATKGTGNLQQQGNADTDVKMEMLYSAGGTSLWITSGGLIFAKDSAGKITWGWDNTNKVMRFSSWSSASGRVSRTIDRFGQEKQYAANGTTLIFASTTTGRRKYYNRTTGNLYEHIEPDGTRTIYRPNGTTSMMKNYTAGRLVL